MAGVERESDIKILKNSTILVNVIEAVEDILIVSYTHESRIFQGALLDSTKKGLPCGITPSREFLLPPSVSPVICSPHSEEVGTSALSGRYTYFQDKSTRVNPIHNIRRTIRPPARYRKPSSKMTVRLRPRQVLCNKCRSICTENSENVDISAKKRVENEIPPENVEVSTRKRNSESRKCSIDENIDSTVSRRKRSSEDLEKKSDLALRSKRINNDSLPSPSSLATTTTKKILNSSVTEFSEPNTKNHFTENNVDHHEPPIKLEKIKIVGNYWISPSRDEQKENSDSSSEERMVLRKKRSVGSMEDLWDETVFEDPLKKKIIRSAVEENNPPRTTTPVIKISFGAQGTVVKIPSKIQNSNPSLRCDEACQESTNKAAKKALKKAKKETRRKLLGSPSGSRSPPSSCTSSHLDQLSAPPRKHKHKMKHRKKHKDRERTQQPGGEEGGKKKGEGGGGAGGWNIERTDEESYSAIKEQCLKQRLSISLKRLNANAYMRCDSSQHAEDASHPSSSPDLSEDVPNFPPSGLLSCVGARAEDEEEEEAHHNHLSSSFCPPSAAPGPSSSSTLSADPGGGGGNRVSRWDTKEGRSISVGDVVWGKIHGFPWWPGKVMSITVSSKERGVGGEASFPSPLAHVAWYASSTSSLMPCEQLNPFLETFKMRHNKKKRGPYKEAIRQATSEAQSLLASSHWSPLREPSSAIMDSSSSPISVVGGGIGGCSSSLSPFPSHGYPSSTPPNLPRNYYSPSNASYHLPGTSANESAEPSVNNQSLLGVNSPSHKVTTSSPFQGVTSPSHVVPVPAASPSLQGGSVPGSSPSHLLSLSSSPREVNVYS